MPASFNKIILLGNITRDPETRSLPSGNLVATFNLAVNRNYTTKDGEKREEAMFIDVEAFGKQAEIINKYCKKGSGLLVEGRLRQDKWEDKETGKNRSKHLVVLDNFTFVGGAPRSGSEPADYGAESAVPPARTTSSYSQGASSRPASRPSKPAPSPTDMEDGDVPF